MVNPFKQYINQLIKFRADIWKAIFAIYKWSNIFASLVNSPNTFYYYLTKTKYANSNRWISRFSLR